MRMQSGGAATRTAARDGVNLDAGERTPLYKLRFDDEAMTFSIVGLNVERYILTKLALEHATPCVMDKLLWCQV